MNQEVSWFQPSDLDCESDELHTGGATVSGDTGTTQYLPGDKIKCTGAIWLTGIPSGNTCYSTIVSLYIL